MAAKAGSTLLDARPPPPPHPRARIARDHPPSPERRVKLVEAPDYEIRLGPQRVQWTAGPGVQHTVKPKLLLPTTSNEFEETKRISLFWSLMALCASW